MPPVGTPLHYRLLLVPIVDTLRYKYTIYPEGPSKNQNDTLRKAKHYIDNQSGTVDLSFSQPPDTFSNLVGAPLLAYVALYKVNALFINAFHANMVGATIFFHDRKIILCA